MSKRKDRIIKNLKKKEYNKSYLKAKEARSEKPNAYPMTRLILIRDFFRTPDLYKALFFFLSAQITIGSIGLGMRYDHLAGFLNIFAITFGLIVVSLAIREINKRQRQDETRRRMKPWRTVVIIICVFVAVVVSQLLLSAIGIESKPQPNQNTLDQLYSIFPIAVAFVIVVVSPVLEELVFRELLPYATGPSYMSFIISSFIFMLLHTPYGVIGWINYSILAVAFLYARLKDNNVYSSISVHMVWNLLTIIL